MPIRNKGTGGGANNLKSSALNRGSASGVNVNNPPSGWSSSQVQNGALIMSLFEQAGLSKAGAAGFVGNWMQESGLNSSSPGGYLAQWGGARLTGLLTLAQQMGKPVTSIDVQVSFAMHELKTQYPGLLRFLSSTNDPARAATVISQQYERPGIPDLANRVKFAQQAFGGKLGGGVQGTGGGGGGGGGFVPLNQIAGSGQGFGSILDLINAPTNAIGGWLANIAFNLVKDFWLGLFDAIWVPFWHWNQRSVAIYTEQMFGKTGSTTTDSQWEVTLWTSAFWGLGYWLLFADPEQKALSLKALKPGKARKSRAAHHARFVQSLPARRRLTKPKEVAAATRAKPKPTVSYVRIRRVDTMSTHRPERVRVQSHGRANRSETPHAGVNGTENRSPQTGPTHAEHPTPKPEPNAKH